MSNAKKDAPSYGTPGAANPLPTSVADVEFEEYAPGVVPAADTAFLGRFVRVEISTVGFEFGNGEVFPPIVIFSAVDGTGATRDGEIFELEAGEEYALWLIHQTLIDAFAQKRPRTGELFAVKGLGKRLKRGQEDITLPGASYYGYAVSFPERPKARELSWDEALQGVVKPPVRQKVYRGEVTGSIIPKGQSEEPPY